MTLRSSHSKTIHWFLSLTLLLTVLVSTSTARADVDPRYKAWTTVGSAGTIDEASTGKLVLQGSAVAFPELLPPTTTQGAAFAIGFPLETVTATVRYNVVATDGLVFEGADILFMKARFRDDGVNAQVVLRLIEENIDTGATRVLASLDSNAFAPSANYQTQTVTPFIGRATPDFLNNAYYVEATLIQRRSPIALFGGKPGLEIIQLYKTYNFTG